VIGMVQIIYGKNCKIEDGVILGYDKLSKLRAGWEKKCNAVVIGDNVRIRSGSIIYAGVIIGDDSHVGHNSVLREFTRLGHNSSIGSNTVCEGYTYIGDYSVIQSQVHITARMSIGDYVFIAPHTTFMNDRRMRYARSLITNSEDEGPIIRDGVAIAGGVTVLPKTTIDMGCIIGAGSVVTKDCNRFGVYYGVPATRVRNIKPDEVVDYYKKFYEEWVASK
jgi:acetyltransferase-like isoleucine patch superfamily enzyme